MTSVRGSDRKTVYRELDVERDYEEAPRRHYTTVKRYQVPESISRTLHQDDDNEVTKEKIIIKRSERREDPPPPPSSHHHDDYEYKVTERRYERSPQPSVRTSRDRDRDEIDFRFIERRTERSADPPRRDISYRVIERDSDYERPRSEYRVVEKETDIVRAPSPPSPERVREFRFERERSVSPPRERPYDIERYSKSTEYFAQPQPQPIIIRESAPQAPIIIREERREPQKIIIRREVQEPQYEFVERREVKEEETRDESRSLVKKEDPPPEPTPVPEKQPEEDYFYERRVIERRRRSDSYDRKTEIRPRDSASNYSSDDSYEYVRREKTTGDDRDSHHRRHIAEGAIAGVGAAEILRHHRKSEGKPVSGRGRSAIGGAAVGALGAEALSRVRSMRSLRRGSSSSRSRSGDRHRRRKHRSRSRSKSLSRAQQLGGLAAVAAVGALAGYALKNRGNKETVIVNDGRHHRRSRSRRRRGSVDTYFSEDMEHRDPDHRNRRIAQAGLASAAAAGIWEKVRSRSRGAKGGRSPSRIRQGVPIAAAGLGGAALAGLYEKNKANKEAKKGAIIEDELNRGRRRSSRSRSRSRSVPAPYIEDDDRSVDGPGLIAYGRDPIHPDDRPYYSDEEPGLYRRRGGSSGSSPDTRRRRSKSRSRQIAEGAALAGGAGLAAHQYNKHRNRSRSRSRVEADRRREEDEYYGGDRGYANEPYSPPPMVQNGYGAPPQNAQYGQQQQGYGGSPYFPPPPTGENVAAEHQYAQQNAYPAYNPADYAQQPPAQHPYETSRGVYSESDANLGNPYPNDTFAGDARYGADEAGRGRGRPDPEHVSAPNDSASERQSQEADGLATPRPRSTSRVRFDLESNVTHSPEANRRKDDAKRGDPSEKRQSDTESSGGERKHRRRKRKGKERDRDGHSGRHKERDSHRDSSGLMHDKYDRQPEDGDSDDTEELPSRFDENGNRKPDDPLAAKINDLLSGQGGLGGLFKAITGGSGDERDDDSRGSRRKHRR